MRIFFYTVLLLLFSGCSITKDKEVKFYGNVDVRTVSLGFRVAGKIDSIKFDEGQKIKKDEVIATIENSLYKEYLNEINAKIDVQLAQISKLENGYRKEDIDKAKATLMQSEISKEKAKKDFERANKLINSKSISQQEYDRYKEIYDNSNAQYLYAKSSLAMLENGYQKEDIASAKATLQALQAQKNIAQINLDDTSLYSPVNATLLTRIYEVGSIVNSSQNVVELAKDDEYWVRSYMSERYLGLIKEGVKAIVYSDNGKTYEGVVSFISPLAEFTPKTVQTEDLRTDLVYRFRIILKNYDDTIKQGMPVTIKFPELTL